MHDESTQPGREPATVAEIEKASEQAVLTVLVDDPGLWHLDEIARQVYDPQDLEDAVNRLATHGLVHRIEAFAFASRAALRAQRYVP
jgi:hypothetical protein